MKIQFLGHSGFLLNAQDTLLIQDPWLSNTGAFDSAWFQFPCNHYLEEQVIDFVSKHKTYIYISHEHKESF